MVTMLRHYLTVQLSRRTPVSSFISPCSVRWYRGEAGEGVPTLSSEEEAFLRIAKPRSEKIFARHIQMPSLKDIPQSSLDPSLSPIAKDAANKDEQLRQACLDIRRKRLIYRSKQRGWLEVDLLLGTWASENVPSLNADELDQFEAFVNRETIDIYNVITLRLDIPEDLKTPTGDGIVERIQDWARNCPLGKADPEMYKSVKAAANLI
jgi:succinate dehydrogenase flavin-adding protein (antitoxin of CptAB toxin-antitoxin module)